MAAAVAVLVDMMVALEMTVVVVAAVLPTSVVAEAGRRHPIGSHMQQR